MQHNALHYILLCPAAPESRCAFNYGLVHGRLQAVDVAGDVGPRCLIQLGKHQIMRYLQGGKAKARKSNDECLA